jgi:hypothetical protein
LPSTTSNLVVSKKKKAIDFDPRNLKTLKAKERFFQKMNELMSTAGGEGRKTMRNVYIEGFGVQQEWRLGVKP